MGSDASWKCSNRPHGGWEKPGFRGFPSQTIYTRQQGSFNRNIGEWRHMSRNRKVLWTRGGGRDRSIYCRKELRVQRLTLNSRFARVENNVDYWGADIRNFRSRGIQDCYNNCYRQAGCFSFTMSKRDNYCWLKRKFNGARRKTNQRHLVSANMVYKAAQIKARRVKAARTLYLRYNNLYVSYGKRFNSYNAQYNSASKKVRTYVNQHNYWVRKANAEAVNVQAAAHKKRAAAIRAYIKKAKSFTGRIASAKKLQALRHRQRSAALKKFNSYKAKRHSYYVSYKRIAG